ncbi:MAG: DUF2076 domain-containing protein [Xylophilus ampelinus]
MSPQEQHLLDEFLQRLAAVHGVDKDPEADALIRQRLAAQPDAAYLLVQRSLLQDRALESAKRQIEQLQQQLRQAQDPARQGGDPGGRSFLGAGLEPGFGRAPSAPGLSAGGGSGEGYGSAIGAGVGAGGYGAAPMQARPPQPAPSWRERLFGGGAAAPAQAAAAPARGGSSFLGNAAAAAAGVAGGMFLFNGIESLMHGNQHAGGNGLLGGGNDALAGAPQESVTENVTNNYYESPQGGDTGRQDFVSDDTGGGADGGGNWFASDDGSGGFFDGGDDDQFA